MTRETNKSTKRIYGAAILAAFTILACGPTSAADKSAIVPVPGIIRAAQEATLSTDLIAKVEAVGFVEGQSFKKGDKLISFDCRADEARYEAAKAAVSERAIGLRSAKYLLKRNAGNKHDVDIARAQEQRANAELAVIAAKLERCEVVAPYDGYVSEKFINPHEMSGESKPLISIVQRNDAKIELIVPSNWLTWVKTGVSFHFMVDETGQTLESRVERVGSVVDAVSQTIKLYGSPKANHNSVLPGMSGTAIFPYEAVN